MPRTLEANEKVILESRDVLFPNAWYILVEKEELPGKKLIITLKTREQKYIVSKRNVICISLCIHT